MKKEIMVDLGATIKNLRKTKRMTQTDLADGNCDRTQVVGLEHGSTKLVDLEFIIHASERLAIPYCYLLDSVLKPRDKTTDFILAIFEAIFNYDAPALGRIRSELSTDIPNHVKLINIIDCYSDIVDENPAAALAKFKSHLDLTTEFFDIYSLFIINGFLESSLKIDSTNFSVFDYKEFEEIYITSLNYYAPIYPEIIRRCYCNLADYFFRLKRYGISQHFILQTYKEEFIANYNLERE